MSTEQDGHVISAKPAHTLPPGTYRVSQVVPGAWPVRPDWRHS
jgi:hypothetical protein